MIPAPSLYDLCVAPVLGLAVLIAMAGVIFALADAAGRRRERSTELAQHRERMRRREAGRASADPLQ